MDRDEGGTGSEQLGDAERFELGDVGIGDDPAAEHNHIVETPLGQEREHPGEKGHVRTGEQRQAHGIGVFLQCRLGDLFRGLVQTGVNHLEPAIAQGSGDHFRATIMTIEARLGDNHSVTALHAGGTLAISPGTRPNAAAYLTPGCDPAAPGWTLRRRLSTPDAVANQARKRRTDRQSDLRLLIGAAVAVIIGGIVVAAAILAVTSGGALPDIRKPQPFGSAADIGKKVKEGGPINMAGLSGDDGFWVALEHGERVALLVDQPGPPPCTLRWRGSKGTFTCNDRPVKTANLARFRSFTSRTGPTKGLYMVELKKVLPAPEGAASAG